MSAFSFDTLKGFFASREINQRQEKIADILASADADIVALQEIHTYFVLKLLRSKLTSYPHVIYKKFLYGPKGGLVTFSKLPLEEVKYTNFQKRGSLFNTSFIARVTRNGILSCKLKTLPIYVLNTHASPNLDHDHSENNRFVKYIVTQLNQIAKFTNQLSSNKQAVIVAGDLNTGKDSDSYKNFIKKANLTDVFSKFSYPTQHQEFLPKNKTVKCIDYIFVGSDNAKINVLRTSYLFTKKYLLKKGKLRYLSDHIGLKADFNFQF